VLLRAAVRSTLLLPRALSSRLCGSHVASTCGSSGYGAGCHILNLLPVVTLAAFSVSTCAFAGDMETFAVRFFFISALQVGSSV